MINIPKQNNLMDYMSLLGTMYLGHQQQKARDQRYEDWLARMYGKQPQGRKATVPNETAKTPYPTDGSVTNNGGSNTGEVNLGFPTGPTSSLSDKPIIRKDEYNNDPNDEDFYGPRIEPNENTNTRKTNNPWDIPDDPRLQDPIEGDPNVVTKDKVVRNSTNIDSWSDPTKQWMNPDKKKSNTGENSTYTNRLSLDDAMNNRWMNPDDKGVGLGLPVGQITPLNVANAGKNATRASNWENNTDMWKSRFPVPPEDSNVEALPSNALTKDEWDKLYSKGMQGPPTRTYTGYQPAWNDIPPANGPLTPDKSIYKPYNNDKTSPDFYGPQISTMPKAPVTSPKLSEDYLETNGENGQFLNVNETNPSINFPYNYQNPLSKSTNDDSEFGVKLPLYGNELIDLQPIQEDPLRYPHIFHKKVPPLNTTPQPIQQQQPELSLMELMQKFKLFN